MRIGFVWSIRVRLGSLGEGARGHRVGMVSLGPAYGSSGSFCFSWVTRTHIGVVGFIRVRMGSLGGLYGSSGSFVFAWIYSCASKSRMVPLGSRGFTKKHLVVVGFIGVRVVHSGAVLGRQVHSSSHRFAWARLGIVGFILVHVGSLGLAK